MSETRLATIPDASNARLPANYEAMKTAIAECANVDECATWASKAAALASYARQVRDEEGEREFRRVRARAIRRCGELLKEIPAKAHGSPSGRGAPPHHSERAQAASCAGLSPDQTKDALRIAKVPTAEFEDAVESDDPPTLERLAGRGLSCGPLTRRDKTAHIAGLVESLHQSMRLFEAVKSYDLDPLVEHGTKKSLKELINKIDNVTEWLRSLRAAAKRRTQ